MQVIELNSAKDYEELALKAATLFVEQTNNTYDEMTDVMSFEKAIC